MNVQKKQHKRSFKNSLIKNILLIIVLSIVLLVASLVFLHIYTRQNKSVNVPEVKGLQLKEAKVLLKSKGLKFAVNDSIFDKNAIPGAILDQVPAANSKTKEGRVILLTIYSNTPPEIEIPELADFSLRQAEALLISMGFEKLTIEKVASEYDDLVQSIEYKGREVHSKEKIPVGSPLTVIVGSKALLEAENDENNSYIDMQKEEHKKNDEPSTPIVDESFF